MTGAIEHILEDYEAKRISRRTAVCRLGAVVAAVAGAAATPLTSGEDGQRPTFEARALNHIALRVRDVARSRDFYTDHLGLKVTSQSGSTNCFLDCGPDNFVALFRAEQPGLDHYCYTIDDYRAGDVVDRLRAAGLEPRREDNRVYFDDPDGITVQLSAP